MKKTTDHSPVHPHPASAPTGAAVIGAASAALAQGVDSGQRYDAMNRHRSVWEMRADGWINLVDDLSRLAALSRDAGEYDSRMGRVRQILKASGTTAILVTKDLNMQLKARALGIEAQDYRTALEYQDRLMPLHEAIFIEPGLAGAKYGLSLLGLCSEEVRLPLVGLTDGTKAKIKAAMQHAGIL